VSNKPSWKQEDCFPIILETIRTLSAEKKREWISHDELVDSLLDNPQIVEIIKNARMHIFRYENVEERRMASNMVAWFSQKITEYECRSLSKNYYQFHIIEEAWLNFDRIRLGGKYAYRIRESRRFTKPIFVEGKETDEK